MCVYNREEICKQAIESILKQSYKDFEFIIVDDGSTDGTVKTLRQYQRLDKRIKIICNKHNFIESRHIAFAAARGTYIMVMDSDDWVESNRLEVQLNYIIKNKLDVVSTHILFGDNVTELRLSSESFTHNIFIDYIKKTDISQFCTFGGLLFKRRLLDKFKNRIWFYPEFNMGGEDQGFTYSLYLFGCKFGNTNETTYHYNFMEYPDSISSTVGRHDLANSFCFQYLQNKPYEERMTCIKGLIEKYNQ